MSTLESMLQIDFLTWNQKLSSLKEFDLFVNFPQPSASFYSLGSINGFCFLSVPGKNCKRALKCSSSCSGYYFYSYLFLPLVRRMSLGRTFSISVAFMFSSSFFSFKSSNLNLNYGAVSRGVFISSSLADTCDFDICYESYSIKSLKPCCSTDFSLYCSTSYYFSLFCFPNQSNLLSQLLEAIELFICSSAILLNASKSLPYSSFNFSGDLC